MLGDYSLLLKLYFLIFPHVFKNIQTGHYNVSITLNVILNALLIWLSTVLL